MRDEGSPEERMRALLDAWRGRNADPDTWQAMRAEARVGPSLHPGEMVGERYQLRSHAGDGPLVATWAAWDAVKNRPAAVKVLHGQHVNDPAGIVAFHRAANRAMNAGGEWEGFQWFAVDGDPGPTLHQRVVDGSLDSAGALVLVVEAGQLLAEMHATNLLHGLVSPDSIRIDASGAAQLHDAGLFTPNAAMGMAWLAPERLDPSVVPGTAADVYGLAMSVLFALNGRELPFWAWRAPERLVEALGPPLPALPALQEAISWDPDARGITVPELVEAILASTELRRGMASACVKAGRPRAALTHLDALATALPDDPDLLAERARAMDSLGDPLAEAAWRDALDAHHTRAQARTALEALVSRTDRLELVERGRELLPLLDPEERTPLQHRLGQVLLHELSDVENALPLLEAALAGGHADRGLPGIVEKLRTERGDWEVVQREWIATGQLDRALAVTRYALRADTTAIEASLLERDEGVAPTGPVPALAAALRADEHALRTVVEHHPLHLGALMALAKVERSLGNLDAAWALWQRVDHATDGMGLLQIDGAQQHARAEIAWLLGDIPQAAALWHRRLDTDPEDRVAWWGLARAAFTCPPDKPWFGATPAIFTPEEALARLLAGLLDPRAALRWLALPEATLDPDPMLGLSAAVVDALVAANAVVPALFADLAERYPEAGLPIEAVRWLWCEPAGELLFNVRDTYRWTGAEVRFDRRVERRVLHLPAPFKGSSDVDWTALITRRSGPLPLERTFGQGTPAPAPERPLRTVITAGPITPLELVGTRLTVGGDVDDDMLIDGLEPARLAFENTGEHWYVTAVDAVRVNGRETTERRLEPDQRITFDGQSLRVHRLMVGAPIPEEADDVLLDLPEGWPIGGTHAVLVHRNGTREELLPFASDVLTLGVDPADPVAREGQPFAYRLTRGTTGGYTLEDRTGAGVSELPAVLPLQHGDTFAIGDRTFTFQIKGISDTPALSLGRAERRAMVPLLVFRDSDGNEQLLPVLDDVFSIGRGGGNDLQLSDEVEVSRHHCTLVRGTDGACVLRDAGSQNGTYVNGRVIERHILQVGEVIGIGNARLEFRLGKREDLEADLPEMDLEDVEETTSSRADTAAFRRPTKPTRPKAR